MTKASHAADLSRTAFYDALQNDSSPSIDNFLKMAEALGVPAVYLLEGDQRYIPKIPFIGYASAGEGWTPTEDLNEIVEARFTDKDPVAIGIQGHSMTPVYRDGDILICHKVDGANISNVIGRDCAIYTEDGQSYIKTLQKGSAHDLYTLKSYNHLVYPDIEDIKIKWAAPVVWIKRNNF